MVDDGLWRMMLCGGINESMFALLSFRLMSKRLSFCHASNCGLVAGMRMIRSFSPRSRCSMDGGRSFINFWLDTINVCK